MAAGNADIQVGARRLRVRAQPLSPDDIRYADIWRRAVALYPDYETYRARTTRRIPIVILQPEKAQDFR